MRCSSPADGLVVSYNYLWAREYDRHEESGRKARPACVQIIVADNDRGTVVALFPITSQPPTAERTALATPETDAHRIGLKIPSWIIVDEWNLDDLARSPHIADARPIGLLSAAYEARLRRGGRSHPRAPLSLRAPQVTNSTDTSIGIKICTDLDWPSLCLVYLDKCYERIELVAFFRALRHPPTGFDCGECCAVIFVSANRPGIHSPYNRKAITSTAKFDISEVDRSLT